MDRSRNQFARFYGLLRRRGRRLEEAEDLVQEAYVRLLSYIKSGEKVLEPEAFLARAVSNLEVDQSRRERVRAVEPRALEDLALVDERPGPEEQAASELYVRRTRQTLDEAVGEKTRSAFFMHCLEGMTYDEVGQQLNLSGRSVERHIARAVAVLALQKKPSP